VQMPEQTIATAAKMTPAQSPWRKRRQLIRVFSMRLLLFFIFAIGFFLSVVPWGRAVARAALILPALVSFSVPPPLQFFGEPIRHTQMTLAARTGTAYLDIFAPETPSPLFSSVRGGLVVVSGVGDNRQVPQLVNLLESLARTNLVVVHVTAPNLLDNVLSVQDEDAVVGAFQTLQHLPGMPGKRVGMIAFSAGVPVISFAAADPRIRDEVASVTVFGGYFNTLNFMRAVGRRAVDVNGQSQPWQPNEIPLQVLTTMINRYIPSEDGALLTRAFYDKQLLSATEITQLSPPGRAAYHILLGDEPSQVETNIAALPADLRAELDALAISNALGEIRAPIFLLHDYNDTSLPFTESRAFDAALTSLHHPHRYVEFHIFDHVQMRAGLNLPQLLGDGTQLFTMLADVLETVS
jgi:hypothetical protein